MYHDRTLSFFIKQRGAALLIFMLIFFLAATSWILGQGSAMTSPRQIDRTTVNALAQAKEALIGRAATDTNHPGSLPCPDTNNDGIAEAANSPGKKCAVYIGRLPWKTLGLPMPIDGYGESLWYALSPSLRDSSTAEPINSLPALELKLDDTTTIAALIISPGPPLESQKG